MYTLKILLFPDFFQRLTFPWLEVKFPDYFLTCGNHVRSPDKAEKAACHRSWPVSLYRDDPKKQPPVTSKFSCPSIKRALTPKVCCVCLRANCSQNNHNNILPLFYLSQSWSHLVGQSSSNNHYISLTLNKAEKHQKHQIYKDMLGASNCTISGTAVKADNQ